MKTLIKLSTLILLLVIGSNVFAQTSELIVEPTRATKKACVKGDYKTLEKYLTKIDQKREMFEKYILYTNVKQQDYNYIIKKDIDSDIKYYEAVAYALNKILHPYIKVSYYLNPKYTALTQYHDDGKQVTVIIFNPEGYGETK